MTVEGRYHWLRIRGQRLVAGLPRWLRKERWNIGLVRQSAESIVLSGLHQPVDWLSDPGNRYLADPWVDLKPDGSIQIVAESLDEQTFKGRIVVSSVTDDNLSPVRFSTLVELPVHLSYPQVVKWNGRWLMLCEAWESGGVPVFSANAIEGPWKLEKLVLWGRQPVDPTLLQHNGHWYLFFTERGRGPNNKLRLAHAPSPLGPWTAHAQCAVVERFDGGRPGGSILHLSDGRLVRVGQDCSATYGGGLCFFSVDKLTREHYAETLIGNIAPAADAWGEGLHTLSGAGAELTVIDGKRWVASPFEPLLMIIRKWRVWRRRCLFRKISEHVPKETLACRDRGGVDSNKRTCRTNTTHS